MPLEIRPPLDRSAIQAFVGDEAAEALDDALDGLINNVAVFTHMGDLRIDGDVSTNDLLAQCPGFVAPTGENPWDRHFTIFIRGRLEVGGVLRVAQYFDLYVRDDLRARSILGHTGNLIVKGAVTADEIIAFRCTEEGGLFHGASCDVPLLCQLGGGDWSVTNSTGRTIHGEDFSDRDFIALREALGQLGQGTGPQDAYAGIRDLVTSNRAAELLRLVC